MQVQKVKLDDLVTGNIRSELTGLTELASSLKKGQKTPIMVCREGGKFRILDGHRRKAAAEMAGLAELDAVIVSEAMTPEAVVDYQIIHGMHSVALSDYDKAVALKRRKEASGRGNTELASDWDISPATVTRLLSVFNCIPEVQEAAKAGKIGCEKWYEISRSPDQEETLRLKRDDIRERNRQAKAAKAANSNPPDRTSRVKIPLAIATKEITAQGVVTVAGGKEISLADTETLLREALRAVRDAQSRGLGLKAAQSSWRDMAAKPKAAEKEAAAG